MITISVFKITPNDDIQSIAATKLKEMILTNVEMLIDQLDDGQNIGDHVQVVITDQQFVAEQSGMVFVLSDILDQQKTQRIFDQIDMKTKILIDLDPENKNDWKCGTYASSAVKSCFESRKNMSTKEMLIKVLYNHNKKNNHFETRALLLSALALGLECYEEKSNSLFCSKLMNEDAGHVMSRAYDYDMNKRGISSYIAPAMAKLGGLKTWAVGLASSTYLILQTTILGTIGTTAIIPAMLLVVGVGVSIYAIWKVIVWLSKQALTGFSFQQTKGDESNAIIKLWNYLRNDNNLKTMKIDNDGDINQESKDGAERLVAETQTMWDNAKMYFVNMSKGILWVVLSLIFKIPAWIAQYRRQATEEDGLRGVLTKLWWVRLFRTVDICANTYMIYCVINHSYVDGLVDELDWENTKVGPVKIVATIVFGLLSSILFPLANAVALYAPAVELALEVIVVTLEVVINGFVYVIRTTKKPPKEHTKIHPIVGQVEVMPEAKVYKKIATVKNGKVLIIVADSDAGRAEIMEAIASIVDTAAITTANTVDDATENLEQDGYALALLCNVFDVRNGYYPQFTYLSMADSRMAVIPFEFTSAEAILELIEINMIRDIVHDPSKPDLTINYDEKKFKKSNDLSNLSYGVKVEHATFYTQYDTDIFNKAGFGRIVYYGLHTRADYKCLCVLKDLYKGPILIIYNAKLVHLFPNSFMTTRMAELTKESDRFSFLDQSQHAELE